MRDFELGPTRKQHEDIDEIGNYDHNGRMDHSRKYQSEVRYQEMLIKATARSIAFRISTTMVLLHTMRSTFDQVEKLRIGY